MNKKHDEILSLILKQADSCYKVNSTYRGFIVSFFYYNLALIFCEKNCFSRKNEVLKNLANLQEKYYRLINTNTEFSGEFKESNILERLSNNSHVNKLKIIRENCEKKMKSCKVEQEYYYDNVKEIYEDITFKMKQLISNMIIECINEYNKLTQDLPPCDYAFIAFGSMARNEMTPYSDLEFGILILEDKEEYKEYFRQITRLLHFKIINLRETTSRIMGIKLASEIKHLQNLIPNGVSFDGVGIGGCKSPLGRQNENGEVIFELIATPANLAEYQNETYYKENGSLKEEQFLADSIAHITLILEGKKGIKCFPENNEFDNNLVKDYLKKVKNYFNDSASYLWGKKLEIDQGFTKGQVRALELLLKDIERFSPKMGKVERDGRNYSVKHDFYRLLSTVLSHLALYNNIEANNCWEQLKHLKIKLKLKDIHVEKLKKTLDKIGYHRLQAYNYLKEQKEDASDVIEENDNYYKLPLGIVESIYRCLIPFWYASKCFLNLNGNVASNENPEDNLIFDFDHNSNSLLIKGKIIKLLQGSYQAVTFFKKAIDNCNKTNKTIESSRTMVHALYMLASTQLELHPEYVCEAIKNLQLALEETELYSGKMFAEKIDCLLLLSIALKKDDKKSLGCEKNSEELLEEAKLLIKNHYGDQHSFYAQYLSNKGIFEDYFYHLSIDWNIPLTNDKNFVGRQEYLQQLANHFKQTIGCQNLILDSAVGLGGIGKTYLIIQYLHHPQHNYVSRVWFRGDNPQILLKDYRDFAIDKGFLKKNTTISDSELINSVKHYLETYPGWLIIYDNVENYNDIYEYIPSMGGHVIMSSRRAELPPYVKKENWKIMKIEVFSEEDALKYIKKITSYSGNIEEENMKLLAKELGYLPLALAQAASYIKNTKITVADYLDRYYTNKEALLKNKQLPADSENLPVAYTWDISIMHILDNQCYQGDMLEYSTIWNILQVIAYLYPENIPYTLLQEWLNEKNHEQNVVDNKIDIKSCLNILQDYSLIQFSQDKVSIHRLVQEVIRDRFNLVIFEKVKTDFNEEINLKKISQEKNTIYYPIQQAQLLEKKNIYKKSAEELREAISHFDKIEYKNALEIANCHLYLAIALAQNKKNNNDIDEQINMAHNLLSSQYGEYHHFTQRCAQVRNYIKSPLSEQKSLLDWRLPKKNEQFECEHIIENLKKIVHNDIYIESTICVLLGIYNITRTQVAVQYVYNQFSKYDVKIWFDAKDDLYEQYYTFAVQCGLITKYDIELMPSSSNPVLLDKQKIYVFLNVKDKVIQYRVLDNNYQEILDEINQKDLGETIKIPNNHNLQEFESIKHAILTVTSRRGHTISSNRSIIGKNEIIYVVKSYLECYPGWLLIYDNVKSYKSIKKFIPNKGGFVLITSSYKTEWNYIVDKECIIEVDNELKVDVDNEELNKDIEKLIECIEEEERNNDHELLSSELLIWMMDFKKTSLEFNAKELIEEKLSIFKSKLIKDVENALVHLQNYCFLNFERNKNNFKVQLNKLLHSFNIRLNIVRKPVVNIDLKINYNFLHDNIECLLKAFLNIFKRLKEYNQEVKQLLEQANWWTSEWWDKKQDKFNKLNKTTVDDFLWKTGRIYEYFGNIEKACFFTELSNNLRRSNLGFSFEKLAYLSNYLSKPKEKVLEYVNRSLEYGINDKGREGYRVIGHIMKDYDEPYKAIEYYNKAIDYAKSNRSQKESKEVEAEISKDIGSVYLWLFLDAKKALEYYIDSFLKISEIYKEKEIQEEIRLGVFLVSIGFCLNFLNDIKNIKYIDGKIISNANEYFTKTINIPFQNPNGLLIGQSRIGLGEYLLYQALISTQNESENAQNALLELNRGIKIYKEMNNDCDYYVIYAYFLKGILQIISAKLINNDILNEIIKNFEMAIDLSKKDFKTSRLKKLRICQCYYAIVVVWCLYKPNYINIMDYIDKFLKIVKEICDELNEKIINKDSLSKGFIIEDYNIEFEYNKIWLLICNSKIFLKNIKIINQTPDLLNKAINNIVQTPTVIFGGRIEHGEKKDIFLKDSFTLKYLPSSDQDKYFKPITTSTDDKETAKDMLVHFNQKFEELSLPMPDKINLMSREELEKIKIEIQKRIDTIGVNELKGFKRNKYYATLGILNKTICKLSG